MTRARKKSRHIAYDPHIDPSLQWTGKKEGEEFTVNTSSIHVHESIKPLSIIAKVTKKYEDTIKGRIKGQMSLFDDATPAARLKKKREAIEFYQHDINWTNRLIAGDSHSLLEKCLEYKFSLMGIVDGDLLGRLHKWQTGK